MPRIPTTLVTYLPALIGPLAYLAPKGLTILLGLLALSALWAAWPLTGRDAQSIWRTGWPVWPLLALGLASGLWSVVPDVSAQKAGQLFAVATLGCALLHAWPQLVLDRRRLLTGLALGWALAAIVVLADLALAGRLTTWARPVSADWLAAAYSRGAAVHTIVALPLVIGLWHQKLRALAGVTLVLALTPFALEQVAAKLALALAVITMVAVLLLPALRWLLLALQLVAIVLPPLMLPLPYTDGLCGLIETKASVVHRVSIWNFAHDRWAERPWLGWGLDGTRAVPGGTGYADFMTPCGRAVKTLPSGRLDLPQQLPLHTHNAAVQVWLELGIAGALTVLWLVAALAWCGFAGFQPRATQAATAAAAAALFAIAVISFGAWQTWWWSAAVLALGIVALTRQSSGGNPTSGAR